MSASHSVRIAEQLALIKPVQTKVVIFVRREGFSAVVNNGENTVTLPFTAQELPPPGHPVQMQVSDGQAIITGPARPLPNRGIVTAIGDPLTTVEAWGAQYHLRTQPAYLPQVGDEVEITWSADGGLIRGEIASPEPVTPPIQNPGAGGGSSHPDPFTAIDSASFQGSSWTKPDVWASDSLIGAWFYGSKVMDTIPDNATPTVARIFLPARQTSGAAPVLQRHTSTTRPGGPVTFIGNGFALPVRSGWVDFPLDWVNYLKENPAGLGLNHGGYNIYKGVGSDGLSGALDLAWTTP